MVKKQTKKYIFLGVIILAIALLFGTQLNLLEISFYGTPEQPMIDYGGSCTDCYKAQYNKTINFDNLKVLIASPILGEITASTPGNVNTGTFKNSYEVSGNNLILYSEGYSPVSFEASGRNSIQADFIIPAGKIKGTCDFFQQPGSNLQGTIITQCQIVEAYNNNSYSGVYNMDGNSLYLGGSADKPLNFPGTYVTTLNGNVGQINLPEGTVDSYSSNFELTFDKPTHIKVFAWSKQSQSGLASTKVTFNIEPKIIQDSVIPPVIPSPKGFMYWLNELNDWIENTLKKWFGIK